MKYANRCLVIGVLLFNACYGPEKDIKQKDSTSKETTGTAPGKSSNQVRSTAPDAVTNTEQGYALPRFDDGSAQSPINILSASSQKDNNPEILLKFNTEINAIENLGHAIQLDFAEGGTTIAGGKTYKSKQFHFHTPSEHLIDGMTFPMEMHIVNILKNESPEKSPKYLVIGILFKMGRENKFIKEFLNMIPWEENKKETLQPGTVVLEDLFNDMPKNEMGAYFFYNGSLTTPPYSETVDWIVQKYIFEASAEQIASIEKMEGDNSRHIQELYTRKVLSH